MVYKLLLVLEIVCDIGDFEFQLAQLITQLKSTLVLIIEVGNVVGRKSIFLSGRYKSHTDTVFDVKFIFSLDWSSNDRFIQESL